MLTLDQYWFLTNSPCLSPKVYNDVGMECYADGCIDDFGLVTPKGHEAIAEFTGKIQPAFREDSQLPYGLSDA